MLQCIILFVLIPINLFLLFLFVDAFVESSWESRLLFGRFGR